MKKKIIKIIGFGIERERSELMADEVLDLFIVTQQRELFYNFITWYNAKPNKDKNKMIFTSTIEEYLKL